MLYCIIIKRELEDDYVDHHSFDHEPTREEVLEHIKSLDLNYDDDYGKFSYYRVN